ncbi:MAG: hypothetical protein ACTFAL_16925 [Candidatus Electronema sp. V4]|uniref:hypothetical protein n=1 Tax=Candidatus Electronema sp. V4 TaxID=3454756 RepID=UPI0040557F89
MKKIERQRLNDLLKYLDAVARRYSGSLPIEDDGASALMREVVSDWLYEEFWQKSDK